MGFRPGVIMPVVCDLSFFKLAFGGPLMFNAYGDGLGLVEAAAVKTRGIEVEIEQVVLGFVVARIQSNCFFEILAGLGGVDTGHQPTARLGAPSPSAA